MITDQDVDKLKQVFATKDDMMDLKQDISSLKQDVSGLKQDVSTLKQDVSGLKQDVSTLKQDVSDLKQDISEIKLETKEFVKKKDLEKLGATISSEFNIVIDMVGDLHTKFDEQQVEIRSTRIFKGEAEARLQGIERQILKISK